MGGSDDHGIRNEVRQHRTVDGVRYTARVWHDYANYNDEGEDEPLFRATAFREMGPGETSVDALPRKDMERIFPELAAVVRLDRSTFDGVPKGAEASGRVALGFGLRHPLPGNLDERPAQQDLRSLAELWRVSDAEAQKIAARMQDAFASAVKMVVSSDARMRGMVKQSPSETIEQSVLRDPSLAGRVGHRVRDAVNNAIDREIDRLRPRWAEEARTAMEVFLTPRKSVDAGPPSPTMPLIMAMESVEDTPEKRTVLAALRDNLRAFREAAVDYVADPVNKALLGLGDRLLNSSFPFEKLMAARMPAMAQETRAQVISGIADRIENGPMLDRASGPSMR